MKLSTSAKKLTLYFLIILVVFSFIISLFFIVIFHKQTLFVQEKLLVERAQAIASEITAFDQDSPKRMGSSGLSSYLRSINTIAGAEAWVVDENYLTITPHGSNHMGHGRNSMVADTSPLPSNLQNVVDDIFKGNTYVSQKGLHFNDEQSLLAGAPVYGENQKITYAVLLYSPLSQTNAPLKNGLIIFAASLLVGLVLSFILSPFLAKNFTDPILLKEAQQIIDQEKDKNHFVFSIAHELKTPLTVVKSSLETLSEKEAVTQEEVKENNQEILEEITSLQRLVEDLFDLAKLESTGFSLSLSTISLEDLVNNVLRSSRKLAKEKNIVFEVFPLPDIEFLGDYDRLRQMLLIVLSNGIKFSPVNSLINISWKNQSLMICDEGVGISDQDLPHIFDRFYKKETDNA